LREPACEHTEDESDLGRKREIGGHADENAEREPNDGTDQDSAPGPAHSQAILYRNFEKDVDGPARAPPDVADRG
jgi:hypothetical protein